jgi:D-glycero-alpha-D-manno-heptose 1-phosphate guanylyltransferase
VDVIILAGGLGTRLQSVVNDVPKCMAPICGKPFLYYLLKYLSRYHVNKVILSVGYLREKIFEWINVEGKQFPFTFDYAIETKPLGTGGGIKLALTKTNSHDVCILNGDTFFDVDLKLFYQQHKDNKSTISIALKPMNKFDRYGNVITNNNNVVTCFSEKSYCERGNINGGIYLINNINTLMCNFPEKFSFEIEFLHKQISKEKIFGFVHNGYFIDIGIPEDYTKANVEFNTLF